MAIKNSECHYVSYIREYYKALHVPVSKCVRMMLICQVNRVTNIMLIQLAAPLGPLNQSFTLPVVKLHSRSQLAHFLKRLFKRVCMTSCHKCCT